MDDTVKILSDAMLAFIPADSKGLLICKVTTSHELSHSEYEIFGKQLVTAADSAGLKVGKLLVCEHDGIEISFQMLTDDQLRDIGFQRIKPKQDMSDITRSFG